MQIDRDATLKSAEKLLRQGKLDAAIAEYVRVVGVHPNDWTSVNALGDLYVRAGQNDRAIAQFARVGDHLVREGSLAKAAAVFKKILKINPSDLRGTRGLAQIAEKQNAGAAAAKAAVPADDPDARVQASRQAQDALEIDRACALLIQAADLYQAQGRGADALAAVAEASSIDPANTGFRERMLRMLIEQGEIKQARSPAPPPADLLIVADALNRQNRGAEMLDIIAEAVDRDPQSAAMREQLVAACLKAGDIERARAAARGSREWLLISEALKGQSRGTDALAAMREAAQRDPHNVQLHAQFVRACIDAGDLAQARAEARTKGEIVDVSDALETQGDNDAALQMRADALRRDPDDPALRVRLIRDYMRAGDRDKAHGLLTLDVAGDEPELVTLLARLEFGIGRMEEGTRALNHLLAVRPDRREDLVTLGCELADAREIDAAYVCIELFAESATAASDWDGAAAGLQEFVTRVPNHVSALVKLVEVCVDGDLGATMYAAQGQLADAYLAAGLGTEARVVTEDLVLRAPWNRASVERCRRALVLCQDPEPDRTIADLLSGDGPFALEEL